MLKVTAAVLAVVLAGSASAGGWRKLHVDGSSEEAFAQSLERFKDKLSPARRYVFGEALKDIWIQGQKTAEAEQGEYVAEDYYAQVDGLGYDEIVTFTDPSGDTAKRRYRAGRAQYQRSYVPPPAQPRTTTDTAYLPSPPYNPDFYRGWPTQNGVPGRDGR